MVSCRILQFGGYRYCGGGNIMFFEVEEQDFTCSFIFTITVFPKARGILYSHTRNFTVNRTLIKIFVSVSVQQTKSDLGFTCRR